MARHERIPTSVGRGGTNPDLCKKSQLAFPHAMSVAVHIKHVADGVYILLH